MYSSSSSSVFSITYLLLIIQLLTTYRVKAHQAICFPRPMSRIVACRISSNSHCPGPCPDSELRKDQTPDNPSLRTWRGARVEIRTLRNNHDGGFVKWSIVNIRDKMNRAAHTKNTFLITCADLRPTKCTKINKKRDCPYDKEDEYFRHQLEIPTNIPDGTYILGWAWYGGGRVWGTFGDYYDCMYIRIKGGDAPIKYYRPKFYSGPSRTGGGGFCMATVNRLGICYSEPCPKGGSYTKRLKPYQFANKKVPRRIPRSYFKPYVSKKKTNSSPNIKSMTVRDPHNPNRVYSKVFKHLSLVQLKITTKTQIAITCEVNSPKLVKYVSFFVHGAHIRTDLESPYSLAGDWFERGEPSKKLFSRWQYDYANKVMSVTCKAIGFDGTVDYLSIELSTGF